MCKEVIDCNCARLTVLLAETAADTADLAHIHEGFSFFVGVTSHKSLLFVRDQLD